MSRKYAFIASEEGHYPLHLMFRWAKVSKSGFYEWKGRGPSYTSRRRTHLARLITALFEASDGTYGYRRVHADLLRSGYWADDDTVRQIMRELDLVPCQPRPFRPVTTIAGDTGQTPDLVKRHFNAVVPGTKLVGDITYIPTWEGWLYLATVLDCATKKVVGYAMADHMRASLVVDALKMAARNVRIVPMSAYFTVTAEARADSTGRRNTPESGGLAMGPASDRMMSMTGRPAMRSPGRPPARRDVERVFWGSPDVFVGGLASGKRRA
ncbi:IS3 family transposase [Nakamurella sp. PAMC28650]|uniref:IS3 family transposase n=1 Tax=Nakamurella sp. PAMC28650 TaxID=2762325 RepID=UPI00164D61E9|nr:IS3 family transposase [Nakamurella sp. PAMC28650]QNK80039.1 IS3 family transposase [Nakamurella sp. PAMC28650]